MKTTIRLLAIFALVLVTLGQYSTASAANTYKGAWARASFETVDASGCIVTRVAVYASNPAPRVEAYIYKEDTCTGEVLMNGYGYTWLDRSALDIAGNLDSAAVRAKVTTYDQVSNSSFDVFVNVMWTATSPMTRYVSNYRERRFVGPGMCNSIEHEYYHQRDAQASGTVSNGEINFTPQSSVSADLSLQKETYMFGCDAMMEATIRQQIPVINGEVSSSKFMGVYANFVQTDPSGCIDTSLDVGVTTGAAHPGSKDSWASVDLFQYDECNHTVVRYAVNYYVPLTASEFKIAGNSATLKTTATVHDIAHDQYIDISVDLNWTASGPMNLNSLSFQRHSPDCDEHSHETTSWRDARAWGTLSSTETDLTSAQLTSAQFYWSKYVGSWCG